MFFFATESEENLCQPIKKPKHPSVKIFNCCMQGIKQGIKTERERENFLPWRARMMQVEYCSVTP